MRVAITAPTDRIPLLQAAVARHGLIPVPLPCVKVQPAGKRVLRAARAAADQSDVVIIASPRVVRLVWPAAVSSRPILSVGSATARAVTEAGGVVASIGTAGLTELVVQNAATLRDRRVGFPRSSSADPEGLAALVSVAARVVDPVVYHARPLPPGNDDVDGVLFTSSTAVVGWASTRGFDNLLVATIGHTTRRAVETHGGAVHAVAERPAYDALVAAMAQLVIARIRP